MTGAIIALFLILLPLTGFVLWSRTQPATPRPVATAPQPATGNRSLVTGHWSLVTGHLPQPKPKRRAIRRPGIDYAAERRIIALALQNGMDISAVAGVLRGSPQARRRRVVKVYRALARPAVAPPQKMEAARVA